MTPEQMRIAIAEECGWVVMLSGTGLITFQKAGVGACCGSVKNPSVVADAARVPDYPFDLNAMHEAWLTLDDSEMRVKFSCELADIVARRWGTQPDDGMLTLEGLIENATALQRAEAFLRTVGKWKGGDVK